MTNTAASERQHREIPLTQGQVALIDDEDYERVSQFKWYANRVRDRWYVVRSVRTDGSRHTIHLHRFILQAPDSLQVDHKNNDGLDNRRTNLRLSTNQQNQFNMAVPKSSTSGYKGVSRVKGLRRSPNCWRAYIKHDGKRKALGVFRTPEEAARAYDARAKDLYGEFARLNFPEGTNV